MSSALEFEADFDRMLQNRIGPLIKVPEHSSKPVFQVLIGGTRFIPVNVKPGGVRHDPQRFMGKSVTVPHFSRDTVEFASRKRDKSNPGIKTLLPFLKKHYGRERFGEFSRSQSGLGCLLLASQDNFNKFIAIQRRSCDLADFERRLISCFS